MSSNLIDFGILFSALTIGLLGNVHCLGMCGGIMGMLGSGHGSLPQRRCFSMVLLANLGRISSYAVLGGIMGGFGFYLQLQFGAFIAYSLRVVAALFMVALGLYLLRRWMGLVMLERLGAKLWARISPLAYKMVPFRYGWQAFAFGSLWGLLPCGLIYSTLVWSISSQSAWLGAAMMLAFGLGTLPGMLFAGGASSRVMSWVKKPLVSHIAGLVVLSFGLYSLLRICSAVIVSGAGGFCHA